MKTTPDGNVLLDLVLPCLMNHYEGLRKEKNIKESTIRKNQSMKFSISLVVFFILKTFMQLLYIIDWYKIDEVFFLSFCDKKWLQFYVIIIKYSSVFKWKNACPKSYSYSLYNVLPLRERMEQQSIKKKLKHVSKSSKQVKQVLRMIRKRITIDQALLSAVKENESMTTRLLGEDFNVD